MNKEIRMAFARHPFISRMARSRGMRLDIRGRLKDIVAKVS
jgi:hypothetical protein